MSEGTDVLDTLQFLRSLDWGASTSKVRDSLHQLTFSTTDWQLLLFRYIFSHQMDWRPCRDSVDIAEAFKLSIYLCLHVAAAHIVHCHLWLQSGRRSCTSSIVWQYFIQKQHCILSVNFKNHSVRTKYAFIPWYKQALEEILAPMAYTSKPWKKYVHSTLSLNVYYIQYISLVRTCVSGNSQLYMVVGVNLLSCCQAYGLSSQEP